MSTPRPHRCKSNPGVGSMPSGVGSRSRLTKRGFRSITCVNWHRKQMNQNLELHNNSLHSTPQKLPATVRNTVVNFLSWSTNQSQRTEFRIAPKLREPREGTSGPMPQRRPYASTSGRRWSLSMCRNWYEGGSGRRNEGYVLKELPFEENRESGCGSSENGVSKCQGKGGTIVV